jgi:inhibitor of KinA sporulation pathway (predicted exonuclease)
LPLWSRHLNVKTLFAVRKALHREVDAAKALKMLDLRLAGTRHRGVDDAWSIAGVLGCLLDKEATVRSQLSPLDRSVATE